MSEDATTPSANAPASGSELGGWAESGTSPSVSTAAPAANPAPATGAAEATPAPVDPAAAVASASNSAPAPAATPEPFQFGGRTWESREKAEHWARTTQGIGRAAQENRLALIEARQQLANYERQLAELKAAQERAAAQPPVNERVGSQPGQADANQPLGDDELAEVFGILQQNNGPAVANRFLTQQLQLRAEQAASSKLSEFEEKLNKMITPLVEQHEYQQLTSQADRLIGAMATYTTGAGQLAFPELQDSEAVAEIGRIWSEMGLPQENLLSIQGLTAAVGLYRMANGYQANAVAASAAPVPSYNSPAVASSAAAVASASGDAPRATPRPMTPQEQVLADIRNAGTKGSNSALSWADR